MENAKIVTINDIKADNIHPGDRVIWTHTIENKGVVSTLQREGYAFKRDSEGKWKTADGGWLTDSEIPDTQIRVHRPIQNPPNENGSVIFPADSRIVAKLDDRVWTALEAIYGPYGNAPCGVYYGVWRSGEDVRTFMPLSCIQPGTWRMYDLTEDSPF